jgi:hypothetical protein
MTGRNNGESTRYQVTYSGVIAKVVQELRYEAFLLGRQQQFDNALRTVLRRLKADPWNFGEVVQPLAHLKLKVHVASVFPVTIRFGIHEDKPLVIITKVIFSTST